MYFMILELLKFVFLQIILSRMTSFFKFLTRCQYFINTQLAVSWNSKVQVGKPSHDFESSKRQPFLADTDTANKIDDEGLCKEEVESVMARLGFFCHPEDELLQERLGFTDLANLFEVKEPCLDEVKAAFDVFDQNRDGFIDAKELQRVLCSLGLKERSEMDDCRKMIRVFDENEDGRIDFHEFAKFMEISFY